ncbi:right-handed parallel beta-helix repeat-containing protein [Candidatus Poribacteria bacterium]
MNSDKVFMPDGTEFPFWDDRTQYAKIYHVAREHPKASDDNPGTETEPFATISRAAEVLQSGEKVIVHKGVYRECVSPVRGGEGPDRMIAYEAASGEEVRVRGSEAWQPDFRASEGWNLGGWSRSEMSENITIWMADLPAEWFDGYNPFAMRNINSEYIGRVGMWSKEHTERFLLRRGLIFADGKRLRQVLRAAELRNNDGVFWVEDPGLRIHFRLPDDADPTKAHFEVTTREQVFTPKERDLGYIRVSGFHFEYAADGIPVPQRSMVSTNRGHHWIIENCEMRWANATGLDFGNESWLASGKTDDALDGGHIIRRNHVSDCGICGIAACHSNARSLVEENLVERVGWQDIEKIHETGGMKFHVCDTMLIRRNVIRGVYYGPGMWLDYLNKNCRVTGNVIADITGSHGGVYIEVTHEPNLVDNNIFWDIKTIDDAGPAVCIDDGEKCVVAHNFFGNVGPWYAISMIRRQTERAAGGAVGLGRKHSILNNILVGCPKRVAVQRTVDQVFEGNLYSQKDDPTSFQVVSPSPPALLNLASWQEYYGFDRSSCQAQIAARFDPENLVLDLTIDGEIPESLPVLELHGISQSSPGPFGLNTGAQELHWGSIRVGPNGKVVGK